MVERKNNCRIDDIEDNSILRRGLPVAHNVYGVPRTLNSANYVYFRALSNCLLLGKLDAVKVFAGFSFDACIYIFLLANVDLKSIIIGKFPARVIQMISKF